jgi:enterochelin esterase-like enzyme
VREVWYHSTVTGSWRHALVYPPPDYNTQTKIRYPVIYLQHGAGKDETGWIRQGKANFILDNLIARGNTKPMIIVMANGSMRGMQTFQVRFNHLDLFSYIGGFSGAAYVFTAENEKLDTKTAHNGAMSDPAMFANRVHLLGTGVGRTNEPDRMKSGLEKLHTSLDEGEIRHVFYESPDTSHEWQTWRRDLKVFAPRLSRLGANRSRKRARGTQEYANFQLWWFEYCD